MKYKYLLILCLASAAWSQEPEQKVKMTVERSEVRPLTGAERRRLWVQDAVWSPGAVFSAAAPAAIQLWNQEPKEWQLGAEGYARRFGSNLARAAMDDTMAAGAAAALGYEVRYVKCGCMGVWRRVGHAVSWGVLTMDRRGQVVLNSPRIGSAFAAAYIANSWMPEGFRSNGDVARVAAMQLGVRGAFNVVREFMPKLRRK